MQRILLAVLLISVLGEPSWAQTHDLYLGEWEWAATLYWLGDDESYPEGRRQSITLSESALTVVLPEDGGTYRYSLDWLDDPEPGQSSFIVLAVGEDSTPEIYPAASACQPTTVSLHSGSTYYGFHGELPCDVAPCILMSFLGCTDAPLYFLAPVQQEVDVDDASFSVLKARF